MIFWIYNKKKNLTCGARLFLTNDNFFKKLKKEFKNIDKKE